MYGHENSSDTFTIAWFRVRARLRGMQLMHLEGSDKTLHYTTSYNTFGDCAHYNMET